MNEIGRQKEQTYNIVSKLPKHVRKNLVAIALGLIFAAVINLNHKLIQGNVSIMQNYLHGRDDQLKTETEILIARGELKTILLWHRYHRPPFRGFNDTSGATFEGCSETRCIATTDRSLLPQVDMFDAVIVRHTMREIKIKPASRDPKQVYIFFSREAPVRSPLHKFQVKGFYNRTLTYRKSSDFQVNYGNIVLTRKHSRGKHLERYIELFGKDNAHLAGDRSDLSLAWAVSNCRTPSKRELLVEALSSYVDIAVYGKCSKHRLTKRYTDNTRNKTAKNRHHRSMTRFAERHKFYLAFENSLCDEYVTEKFFKVLDHAIIPVVFGGADYRRIAPMHSYIDVLDFENVGDLAKYLYFLHANDDKFAEYFWWKDFYGLHGRVSSGEQAKCDICRLLHDPREPTKIYHNLSEWYYGTCKYKLDLTWLNQTGGIKLGERENKF